MSDASQRRAYQNSFHSAFSKLERHLTVTKQLFFGGLVLQWYILTVFDVK